MEDDSSEPIVFATIKHSRKGNVSQLQENSHQSRKHDFSCLNRGHSRSDEALLPGHKGNVESERSTATHLNYGALYKTTSLNRSLAFSEEDIVLGVESGPKRAISSSQLPSKGILKNKKSRTDIRKVKSMEVLSPRVTKGEGQSGQKGKGVTQAEMDRARANFVEGKLQFSAFLNEITKQVLSPSDLSRLGVGNDLSSGKAPTPAPMLDKIKPQLPPKKHRGIKRSETEPPLQQSSRQVKDADSSNPDKLISYATRNHRGSPPPHHYPSPSSHGCKDRRPSPTGDFMSGDRYSRSGPHITDGTSPSPTRPKQRQHHKYQPNTYHNQHKHTQRFFQQVHQDSGHTRPNFSPSPSVQGAGPGFGSESSSTKSDSPRGRETASTATSHSSEQSSRRQSQQTGICKQPMDLLYDPDHFQALQEENADLHQNLLQTVVCIESLEAELQRTREELSHVKEKYKSLLPSHTGTKQDHNLLGEHLNKASESLSSESKFLLNRVSELGSEVEDAHRTITALENINEPCLIKELLERHFGSTEAIQKFLTTSFPISQSHNAKAEEVSHDWLNKSDGESQRATAFMPVKQGLPPNKSESCHRSSFPSDITTSIYKSSFPARPQPVYPQTQKQSSCGANQADGPPEQQQQAQAGPDRREGRRGLKVLLFEEDCRDVNSVSAQQILDDFIQHLQARNEADGGKTQQSVQEWMNGVEQTGKVTD
nr:uncharacterized protein si:ch211-276i12.4 [Nothobranchius furzeri]